MSDYTTPAISDSVVKNLAEEIGSFANLVDTKVDIIKETINKYYTVNHEPKIELPFEGEYDYIYNKVNDSLTDKDLKTIPHIFLSGYLKSGDTITFKPYSDNANEQDNYSAFYINGEKIQFGSQKQYICKAETGAREKLNILILGCPKISNIYKARFVVDYADMPLEDFKMVLYDDVDEPINPDIDSFLGIKQIDTLKVIGNYKWTYSGLCTLRRLELTKDILVVNPMYCPCIQELIIPNASVIPVLNNKSTENPSIVKLDIANVKAVRNINAANLSGDLKADCTSLSGLKNCGIDTLTVGNACTSIVIDYRMANKLICGANIIALSRDAVTGSETAAGTLKEIVFRNVLPLTLSEWVFNNLKNTLETITFSKLAAMTRAPLSGNTGVIRNISFTEPVTSRVDFSPCPKLTEQSILNIINALDSTANVTVALHATTKQLMQSAWYCKLSGDTYVPCAAEDEGAMLQTAALVAKGGTLA